MRKLKIIPIKWVPENHDSDSDGVPNRKDCVWYDPRKQDMGELGYGTRVGFVIKRIRTPGGGFAYAVFGQDKRVGLNKPDRGDPLFIGTENECEEYVFKRGQRKILKE